MVYYLKNTTLHRVPDAVACKDLDIDESDLEYFCSDKSDELFSDTRFGLKAKAKRYLLDNLPLIQDLQAAAVLATTPAESLPEDTKDLVAESDVDEASNLDRLMIRLAEASRLAKTCRRETDLAEGSKVFDDLCEKGSRTPAGCDARAVVAEALLREFTARMANPTANKEKLIKGFAALVGGVTKPRTLKSLRAEMRVTGQKEIAKELGKSKNLGGWRTKRLIAKGKIEPKSQRVVFDGWE